MATLGAASLGRPFEALLDRLSPAALCQAFFVLAAAGVLAVAATPPSARRLLLEYGPRQSASGAPKPPGGGDDAGPFTRLVGWATSVGKVPHSWFIHFYVLSVLSSIFWALQFVTQGPVLNAVTRAQARHATASMTVNQVFLAWLLMFMQGARRLYEYLTIIKPSASRMWVVHWLLGTSYYFCMGISVWIEGAESILATGPQSLRPTRPSLREVVGVSLFIFAWTMQHRCQRYLSGLQKYSLPDVGMFRHFVCPHYTCECLLYLSLAVVAAPEGRLYNQTLACGVLFVSVNLGVTAGGTRKWYADKFGADKIESRWNMIPLVY